MKSILTVVTPATSQALAALADVKAELGITTTAEDANLATWIDEASGVVSDYCNRTFGIETDLETFRMRMQFGSGYAGGAVYGSYLNSSGLGFGQEVDKIVLRRAPVTEFTSIVEDDITLVEETDFTCDYSTGIITRLCNDFERRWCFRKLLVTYTAGYNLAENLPSALKRGTITLVKTLRAAATRDPYLMSEAIPGVRTVQYAVGRYAGTGSGATTWPPDDVVNAIAPYRYFDF